MAEERNPAEAERRVWASDDFKIYPVGAPIPPPSEDDEEDDNDD